MNQALTRFRELRAPGRSLVEDAVIAGNLCRAEDGTFTACDFNAAERVKAKTKEIIGDKASFDWKAGDLAGMQALVDKVKTKGGKADVCLLNPPLCDDSLGVERKDMPQFPKEAVESFIAGLKERGVAVEKTEAAPTDLKATQNEINAVKVLGMAGKMAKGEKLGGGDVFVSSDGYVLDGHHRWAASWLLDKTAKIAVTRIDLPIRKLLSIADRYSAEKKNFWESALPHAFVRMFGDGPETHAAIDATVLRSALNAILS